MTNEILLKINKELYDDDTSLYEKKRENEVWYIQLSNCKDNNFFPYELVDKDDTQIDVFGSDFIKKIGILKS